LTSFERLICERVNLVFDILIYLEAVERFKNMSNNQYESYTKINYVRRIEKRSVVMLY